MKGRIAELSPRFKVRVAGVFYLLSVLTPVFGEIFLRWKEQARSEELRCNK